jgi:hypothetical protein
MKWWLLTFFSFSLFGEQRVYIGPDVFYRAFEEERQGEAKSQEKGFLSGFQAGYDLYLQWLPYLGGDLRFAQGRVPFDGTVQNHITKTFAPFQSSTDNTLFSVEGRLGYTLHWQKIFFSPFFGMGFQRWFRVAVDRQTGYDELYSWSYLAEGFQMHWAYSSWGSLGLNAAMMQTRMAEVQIRGLYSWPIVLTLGEKWQAEVEISLSWQKNPYGISLVPYFRYLPFGESESQQTRRGRIFIPPSRTYVLGGRLECMCLF